jgi:hypothetical protein
VRSEAALPDLPFHASWIDHPASRAASEIAAIAARVAQQHDGARGKSRR